MNKFSFRWGIPALDDGFVPVFNFMIRNYSKAGVTRNEFLLIMHLAAYKYEIQNSEAKPSQTSLAGEMGYKHRNSIIKLVKSLRDKGLLITEGVDGFPLKYDFSPFSKLVWFLWQDGGCTPQCAGGEHPNVQGGEHHSVHEEEEVNNKKEEDIEQAAAAPAPNGNGKSRPRDPWFDALCLVCGWDTSKAPGGEVVKVKKKMSKIGWTVDDVLAYHRWRSLNGHGPVESVHFIAGEMAKKNWRGGEDEVDMEYAVDSERPPEVYG